MKTLPRTKHPIIEIEIPSMKKVVPFKPWTANDEGILLLAATSEKDEDKFLAVNQVISNCIIDPNIKVEDLAYFDIEYIFLQLRAKSVGESIPLKFHSPKSDCPKCKVVRTFVVPLDQIKVEFNPAHTNKFELTESSRGKSLWLLMKYPTTNIFKNSALGIDGAFESIAECMDKLIEGDEVFESKDVNLEERVSFLKSLNKDDFSKIESFFQTMPSIKYDLDLSCKDCGKEDVYQMRDLSDFFV
jgi:hypothetical protein